MEYETFLDLSEKYGANFVRLWRWNELTRFKYGREEAVNFDLHPWSRAGPGDALDGKLKFDLEQFNAGYFERLRSRVVQARERGMYGRSCCSRGGACGTPPCPGRRTAIPSTRTTTSTASTATPTGTGTGG